VTQFFNSDNTTSGTLSKIRRMSIQNSQVIQNSRVNISSMGTFDSITDDFCTAQKAEFGDTDRFSQKGGMVLVMSLWEDYGHNMLWLESSYPSGADPSQPGVTRGTYASASSVSADVEA
jgi:cellulose 1,4-beta-cellobiosidase